jgi:hypothetical protein
MSFEEVANVIREQAKNIEQQRDEERYDYFAHVCSVPEPRQGYHGV